MITKIAHVFGEISKIMKRTHIVVNSKELPTLRCVRVQSLVKNKLLFPPFVYNGYILFRFLRSAWRKHGKRSLAFDSEQFYVNGGSGGPDVLVVIYVVQSPRQFRCFGLGLSTSINHMVIKKKIISMSCKICLSDIKTVVILRQVCIKWMIAVLT